MKIITNILNLQQPIKTRLGKSCLWGLLGIFVVSSPVFSEEEEIDATYFHPAASDYIQGNSSSASNLVAQGLTLFPEDKKLLRLKKLLDQQQEQEQEQKNQEQQNQEQQEQQDQEKNKEKEPQQEDNEQQKDPPQEDQQAEESPPTNTAEEMSQDEAEQLLDAMRQEEKNKRLQLHPVMGTPVKVDKDW